MQVSERLVEVSCGRAIVLLQNVRVTNQQSHAVYGRAHLGIWLK